MATRWEHDSIRWRRIQASLDEDSTLIITRTPLRVSFFGGGTDCPDWYRQHGGAVLATTIDKYCHITCRYLPPFFDHTYRVVHSQIENVREIDEIKHPAVRAILQWAGCVQGLEIHHDGDLPARSGMGSSSAFTVGLIHALAALQGRYCSKHELATSAMHVEQNLLHEDVGSQDQIAAAFGGFNRIEFRQDDTFHVAPVILRRERLRELQDHLMVFFTGFSRFAPEITRSKIENFTRRERELFQMRAMVDEAIALLQDAGRSIDEFGALLDRGWQCKRLLSDRVSTPGIDAIYERAVKAGALGGKLLGAGGGGFLLLFARPAEQARIREALHGLIRVPVRFESGGSQVVLYQPEGDA